MKIVHMFDNKKLFHQVKEKTITFEIPTPEPEFDIAEVLKSSLSDIFDKKLKKLNTEDIVSEAIKKAKGEIF